MPALPALLRALAVWLLIMAGDSAHGALRRALLTPELAHGLRQLAVLVGAVIVFAITWFSFRWLRLRTTVGALAVGVLWVGLTVAFEVGLGRVTGTSWRRILDDYDLIHGGLMPLGLLAMALTPWIVLRLRESPRPIREGPP